MSLWDEGRGNRCKVMHKIFLRNRLHSSPPNGKTPPSHDPATEKWRWSLTNWEINWTPPGPCLSEMFIQRLRPEEAMNYGNKYGNHNNSFKLKLHEKIQIGRALRPSTRSFLFPGTSTLRVPPTPPPINHHHRRPSLLLLLSRRKRGDTERPTSLCCTACPFQKLNHPPTRRIWAVLCGNIA